MYEEELCYISLRTNKSSLYIKSTYKRMCHAKGDNDSTVVCDQILIKKEEEEDY